MLRYSGSGIGMFVRKRAPVGSRSLLLVDAGQFEAFAEIAEADAVALQVVPDACRPPVALRDARRNRTRRTAGGPAPSPRRKSFFCSPYAAISELSVQAFGDEPASQWWPSTLTSLSA